MRRLLPPLEILPGRLALTAGLLLPLFSACTEDSATSDDVIDDIDRIITTAPASTWVVDRFIDSGQDETSDLACYALTFSDDGTVTATDGTSSVTGTWSISDDDSTDDSPDDDVDFNLLFPTTGTLEELNDDWNIVTYADDRIELIDVSGGGGGTDELTLVPGSPDGPCAGAADSLRSIVGGGTWQVTDYEDSGVDETADYAGHDMVFSASGTITVDDAGTTYTGTWSVTSDSSTPDLVLSFTGQDDWDDLSDDWDIVSYTADRIELIDVSGGGGGTDRLTLERQP